MNNNTREIALKNSTSVALVDEDYYEWLMGIEWRLNRGGYASYSTSYNKKPLNYLMHRLVNDTPDGFVTDHINGNKLDNTRANLRTVTNAQNIQCRMISKNNTSRISRSLMEKR